jgi:hypothetical protein
MLYLSLALIFLGIIIFIYSIALDAKRRNDNQHSAAMPGPAAGGNFPGKKEGVIADNKGMTNRGKRIPRSGPAQAQGPSETGDGTTGTAASSVREQKAVLFEDKSNVIDYSSESGSIDPSLEKYKSIKRIGNGTISVENGGITFYMGKKLYRYDFHRIRDIKAGKSHIALFLMGSGSVKLFIMEPGSGIITMATDTFREYVRSSA